MYRITLADRCARTAAADDDSYNDAATSRAHDAGMTLATTAAVLCYRTAILQQRLLLLLLLPVLLL
jgi:hypothetical protein